MPIFRHTHLTDGRTTVSLTEGKGDLFFCFTGPVWDFFIESGDTFTVRAQGYDQDCLDDYFGDHSFGIGPFVDCYTIGNGDNDSFTELVHTFRFPDYEVGRARIESLGGEYEMQFDIEEIPVD
jgi:hypothetical protein